MWFKNLFVYRTQGTALQAITPGELEERLAKLPLKPCAPLAWDSVGFAPPLEDDLQLVRWADHHYLIGIGIESKILPAAVIKEHTKAAAAEWFKEKGFKPGRKMLRDIKQAITDQLLPKALTKRTTTRAWIDVRGNRIVVDTASAMRADVVLCLLRAAFPDLELIGRPLGECAGQPAATLMSTWLQQGQAPFPFTIDTDVLLISPAGDHPSVRYQRTELESMAVDRHLHDGMRVERMALTSRDRIFFALDVDLQLRRIQFIGSEAETTSTTANDDDAFDADFRLMVGTLGEAIDDVARAFEA